MASMIINTNVAAGKLGQLLKCLSDVRQPFTIIVILSTENSPLSSKPSADATANYSTYSVHQQIMNSLESGIVR